MSISRFPVPDVLDLPDDLRATVLAVQERTGFVPHVFLVLAHRPAELRAFLAYHDAVMENESGLTKAEKEMVVVATSAANDCLYCVVAHGAILRIRSKAPHLADQLAVNPARAGVTPKQHAMLTFALAVCRDSARITDADFAALRAHGWTDEDAWDVTAITSLFALSNRMANVTAMQPNDEFFTMGR